MRPRYDRLGVGAGTLVEWMLGRGEGCEPGASLPTAREVTKSKKPTRSAMGKTTAQKAADFASRASFSRVTATRWFCEATVLYFQRMPAQNATTTPVTASTRAPPPPMASNHRCRWPCTEGLVRTVVAGCSGDRNGTTSAPPAGE